MGPLSSADWAAPNGRDSIAATNYRLRALFKAGPGPKSNSKRKPLKQVRDIIYDLVYLACGLVS